MAALDNAHNAPYRKEDIVPGNNLVWVLFAEKLGAPPGTYLACSSFKTGNFKVSTGDDGSYADLDEHFISVSAMGSFCVIKCRLSFLVRILNNCIFYSNLTVSSSPSLLEVSSPAYEDLDWDAEPGSWCEARIRMLPDFVIDNCNSTYLPSSLRD
ncbi:uncharacterized protein ARMOST_12175 [Armillaria ostoyae]|uniref:Uncharacterized protein n=1 Tax=Armillaria ostoyae TaxID=47428 RepID=A0A284RJA1_ARMOS|nr:uncharacterized protein ARMOST_12175 [Armillaria ostoyae]